MSIITSDARFPSSINETSATEYCRQKKMCQSLSYVFAYEHTVEQRNTYLDSFPITSS